MNNIINHEAVKDSKDFFKIISELNENDSYKAYINSVLPNDGAFIKDICVTGFEQYQKNYKGLNFS
jgi:hypothetical protein